MVQRFAAKGEKDVKQYLLRGDYRQMVELAIIMLIGKLPDFMKFHWV